MPDPKSAWCVKHSTAVPGKRRSQLVRTIDHLQTQTGRAIPPVHKGEQHILQIRRFGKPLAVITFEVRMIALTNVRLVLAGFVAGAVLGGATTALIKRHNSPAETLAPAPAYSPAADNSQRLTGPPLNEYGEPASPIAQTPIAQAPIPTRPIYSASVAPAPVH